MMAPMRAASIVLGLALAWLAPRPALAFCRSTTCSADCPRDADDCKTTGLPLYWPTACVGFSIQRDASSLLPLDETKQVIRDAFYAWTDLACPAGGTATLTFAELPETSCHEAGFSQTGANANVILFQENKWDYAGIENNLAKTTVTYDKDTGEILDADMELNQAFNELTIGDDAVVYDVASIVTHEIGHFIGLDHTPDPYATMNAAYEEGTTELRTLEADDVAGACEAYPPDRVAACDPQPRGGFAESCGGGCSLAPPGPLPTGPALAAALAALARRRPRRAARRATGAPS